jgi:F-type H+-transporting ATPase subunit a
MLLYSPLEQFQIVLFELILIRFSNSGLFLCLILIGVILFFQLSVNLKVIPSYGQSTIEIYYRFIIDLVGVQLGVKGIKVYGPFLLSLFTLILGSNLVGLIRYTFTVTSHIAISLGCSIGLFIGGVIIGLWLHKERYFDLFLRIGVPMLLQPALVYIEIVGFIAKALSLGIRLSANMLAGHTLLKLVSILVWGVFTSWGLFIVISVIRLILLILLTGLEVVIAFVQAYVFILLSCSVLPK